MTDAPHLLPGARAGYRIGDGTIVDSMMYDGLHCAFDQCAMGEGAERDSQAHGLEREHMDAMALESHRRADAAQQAGLFENEMAPVTVPQRKGDALVVDASLLHQPSRPSRPTKAALDRTGLAADDVDRFEINEAFAAVGVASADDLGVGMDVVDVNGGAIAIGHPLGLSGNRITLHLALELARRGGGTGAAALCGQGDAIVIRTMS